MREDGREREETWLENIASTHSEDNDTRHVDLTSHPSTLAQLTCLRFGRGTMW